MYPPTWSQWRHLATMIVLVSFSPQECTIQTVNRSVQLFSHSSQQNVVGYIGATWRKWLKLCTLALPGEYDWTRASFGPPESTTQTANQLVQPFPHSSQQKVPILYNGRPFPPKLPHLMGNLDPHLIHDSLGHSKITIEMTWRSIQPLSHKWPQRDPIFYYGRSFPKDCPFL